MSDKDVFTSESKPTDGGTGNDTQNQDSIQSPLAAVVGEGKKYKSVDDLVKGYGASQEHIQKLEAENAELRKATEQARTVQEVLDAIHATNTGDGQEDSLTADKVAKMVQDGIAANAEIATREANRDTANKALVERYGDKAGEMVAKRAVELGMTVKGMQALAETSPNALLQLFPKPEGATGGDSSPTKPTVRTENFQPGAGTELSSYESYAAKRKAMNAEKPGSGDSWYYSNKIQQEMIQKAAGKEDSFFGTQ